MVILKSLMMNVPWFVSKSLQRNRDDNDEQFKTWGQYFYAEVTKNVKWYIIWKSAAESEMLLYMPFKKIGL